MTPVQTAPAAPLLLPAPRLIDNVFVSDALAFLRCLPSDSVDCCVSSPPYFGLRSYLPDGHPSKPDEIGLQDTPAAFVARLVEVYREVRRVLKPTGTCWVNMGDSFASAKSRYSSVAQTLSGHERGEPTTNNKPDLYLHGYKDKDLLMIPARLAIALQDDGWWIRSEIVWAKPNPMPESVTDRPTKAHEMVYMLTKAPRYFYDADAVREPGLRTTDGEAMWNRVRLADHRDKRVPIQRQSAGNGDPMAGRNRRSVWTVATEPTPFAHFATFPQKLIEPMILAGCPATVCAACGKPYVRVVEVARSNYQRYDHPLRTGGAMSGGVGRNFPDTRRQTTGFRPSCDCRAATKPGVVLDPFMGSGTTALVARNLGRSYIGCDLSAEYVQLAQSRLAVPYTPPMPLDAPAHVAAAVQEVLL